MSHLEWTTINMNSRGILDSMWLSDMERTYIILLRKHGIHPDDFNINKNSNLAIYCYF